MMRFVLIRSAITVLVFLIALGVVGYLARVCSLLT